MTTRTVIVQGGGSSAGVLLLLASIVGLVALFSGNLDRLINAIAGKPGAETGPGPAATGSAPSTDTPTTRLPVPTRGGAQETVR